MSRPASLPQEYRPTTGLSDAAWPAVGGQSSGRLSSRGVGQCVPGTVCRCGRAGAVLLRRRPPVPNVCRWRPRRPSRPVWVGLRTARATTQSSRDRPGLAGSQGSSGAASHDRKRTSRDSAGPGRAGRRWRAGHGRLHLPRGRVLLLDCAPTLDSFVAVEAGLAFVRRTDSEQIRQVFDSYRWASCAARGKRRRGG